jgi:PST family polysaccharide transporter
VAALGSLALAFPISWFFRSPAVAPVILVLSATLFIDSLRSVPAAVLAKDMRFKFLAVVEAGKGVLVGAITIFLAFAGFGYWALVAGIVFTSVLSTAFVLLRTRVAFVRPRPGEIKEAIDYTKHFLLSSVSWYVYSNADFAVAGRILGKVALGEYAYAWSLANAPIEKVGAVINRVLPPLYSSVSTDTAELRRYVLKLSNVFAMVAMPVTIGLSLVAGDFISLVLGSKWEGAIAPLRILAFYSLLQCLSLVIAPILPVTGKVKFAGALGAFSAILLPVAFFIVGSIHGTVGIAIVWITVYPLIVLIMCRIAFRAIDLGFGAYLRALIPGLVSSGAMVGGLFLAGQFIRDAPGIWRLAVKVVLGAGIYLAVLGIGWREHLNATVETIRGLK